MNEPLNTVRVGGETYISVSDLRQRIIAMASVMAPVMDSGLISREEAKGALAVFKGLLDGLDAL